MSGSYEYWEKAMANPAALHAREFAVTTTPEPGFYRTYRALEPVAIWEEDGELVITVNGVEIDPNDHERVWLASAKNPVSEEWLRIVEAGGTWPDLDEAVAGLGHNRRAAGDPEEIINDLSRQADNYKEITEDEQAQRALSLRSALLEQHKVVDKTREDAKAPYLKSAREVDEIYMPVVKKAKKWADYLRVLVEAYETRKRRLAREAQLIADFEAQGQVPATITPQAQIRSGYGRAVSVNEKPVVVGIENHGVLLDHLIGTQRELLNAYLMELAQKDVNKGLKVPGVTVEMKAVLR